MLPYSVNASILLTSLPLERRPAAIRAAGFDAMELWWPFPAAVPTDAEVERLVACIREAGVSLTGLNFFGGDLAAGERGVLSHPTRRPEFAANVEVVTEIGRLLGCRHFNALYGLRLEDTDPQEADAVATENLTLAASAVAPIGGTVLLEPVSGAPTYPLKTAADARAVVDRLAGVDNVALLADLYHLAVLGDDVPAVIADHAETIGHLQIADAPGRGAPGTGELPLRRWLQVAEASGYAGRVGLEYTSDAADPFAWLPRTERGVAGGE